MLFNSWAYLLFLPVAVVAYRLVPPRWRIPLLLVASYVFYGWWDYRFLILIWISTVLDFFVGKALGTAKSEANRTPLLYLSIGVNLGILGFFKYWGFFVESTASLLTSIGFEANPRFLSVVLPVGISFYTFQTMSYSIDIYRRQLEPEPSLTRFALFVCFFPQLVAGPIERAARLLPQIRQISKGSVSSDWRTGLPLIARGLFRKVVIADGVAPIVNEVFASPNPTEG